MITSVFVGDWPDETGRVFLTTEYLLSHKLEEITERFHSEWIKEIDEDEPYQSIVAENLRLSKEFYFKAFPGVDDDFYAVYMVCPGHDEVFAFSLLPLSTVHKSLEEVHPNFPVFETSETQVIEMVGPDQDKIIQAATEWVKRRNPKLVDPKVSVLLWKEEV